MGGERLESGYRLGRLEYITQPFPTTYRKPSSPDVGEGVLTLPLAVRREMAVRMGGLYNPRFRKPRPKGGRGRPPLQLDWDGCEIYAAERIRIVTHDMMRGGYRYTYVSRHPARGASGTPPLTGWFLTFPDRSHPLGSIRPRGVKRRKSQKGGWLHKTPGAEKTKKPKRVARGLLRLLGFFVPGPCSATLRRIPTQGRAGTPSPTTCFHPITQEKPPGTSPSGLFRLQITSVAHCQRAQPAQREVSHCQPRHAVTVMVR